MITWDFWYQFNVCFGNLLPLYFCQLHVSKNYSFCYSIFIFYHVLMMFYLKLLSRIDISCIMILLLWSKVLCIHMFVPLEVCLENVQFHNQARTQEFLRGGAKFHAQREICKCARSARNFFLPSPLSLLPPPP